MRSAWKSDRGLLRENNEDAVRVDEALGIFFLADGMGGGPGGEVASLLAVNAAYNSLPANLLSARREEIRGDLAVALAAAHSAVARRALDDPSLQGMGTTLELVVVRDTEAYVCHVGDSRVYLFRRGTLRQITTDDNMASLLAREGAPAEDISPSYRYVLTQAVGLSDEIVPELPVISVAAEDLILICSDGLTEALTDREIAALMWEHRKDLSALAEALVEAANQRGGSDNVSVIVVEPISVAARDPLLLPQMAG